MTLGDTNSVTGSPENAGHSSRPGSAAGSPNMLVGSPGFGQGRAVPGAKKKRNSMIMNTHMGSLVGSSGRQGFADFMKPKADQVRIVLDVDSSRNSSAIQDGDGGFLDTGFGPTEAERLLNEREDLLEDNNIHVGHHSPAHRTSTTTRVGQSGIVGGTTTYGTVTEPDHAHKARNHAEEIEQAWEEAILEGSIHTKVTRELKVLIVNSFPLAITFFLQYSLVVASVFSVGHLGKTELGAVSLGSMTASITGFALIQGMATCLDTLCSQAYGAGRKDLVGMYFQKCVVMTTVFFIPIWILWFKSDALLRQILPESEYELLPLAKQYLEIVAVGIPGYTVFECGKRFLQAQGIFHASTFVLVICAPFNILLNYLLVWHETLGIGFAGAPLAVAITDWLMAILLILYIVCVDGSDAWNGFTWDVFTGWTPLLKLAIPGVIMVETEFWAFEALTLASARLGTTTLAAQTVLSSLTSLVYQIPFALSIATSTRVANFVGAGLKEPAILAAHVAIFSSFFLAIADAVLLFSFRYELAALFSNDEGVIELTAGAFQICCILHVFDGAASVLSGILRGQGRQSVGGYLNLVAYYVIGVPAALFFTFKWDMGLTGLWGGICLCLVFLDSAMGWFIVATDWESVIKMSRETIV